MEWIQKAKSIIKYKGKRDDPTLRLTSLEQFWEVSGIPKITLGAYLWDHAAQFMTMTFDCTPAMIEQSPAAVHVDGTARPQLIRKEFNPRYYGIVKRCYEKTGIPSIINTSFNMHEEPIVLTPEDALRAFSEGRLDYLVLGSYLVSYEEAVRGKPDPFLREKG